MSLSEHELKQLAKLEEQFVPDSLLARLRVRLRARFPRAFPRVGWGIVALAAVMVFVLLTVSVVASFAFVVIASAILVLLADDSTLSRLAGRLRRSPPQADES